jgi:hypothetical protein
MREVKNNLTTTYKSEILDLYWDIHCACIFKYKHACTQHFLFNVYTATVQNVIA